MRKRRFVEASVPRTARISAVLFPYPFVPIRRKQGPWRKEDTSGLGDHLGPDGGGHKPSGIRRRRLRKERALLILALPDGHGG